MQQQFETFLSGDFSSQVRWSRSSVELWSCDLNRFKSDRSGKEGSEVREKSSKETVLPFKIKHCMQIPAVTTHKAFNDFYFGGSNSTKPEIRKLKQTS